MVSELEDEKITKMTVPLVTVPALNQERCTTVETEECPECLNYYEKCDKIPTSFCSDIRYSAQLERLCNKHCGYCSKRRKRSIFDRFPRQSDFTVLEFLADSYHDL